MKLKTPIGDRPFRKHSWENARSAAVPRGRQKGSIILPPPGSIITRRYKGEEFQVKVLAEGFEFAGEVYKTLSGAAKAITGQHCNGFHFFRLNREVAR